MLLSSLVLAHITTDMTVNYRPVLVRMAPTAKARVLTDVGTTTVTPAMLVRLLSRWMVKAS